MKSGKLMDPRTDTSLTLLQKVRAHNDSAWDRFVQIYTPLIRYWCINKSQLADSDANDITQEVFLSASKAIGTFEKDENAGSLRGWLRVITQNKIRAFFRQQGKNPLATGGTTAAFLINAAPDPIVEEDEAKETGIVMKRAVELMKTDFKTSTYRAFWMTAIEGVDTDLVASELGLTTTAVRQACYRVRQRLRAELADVLG